MEIYQFAKQRNLINQYDIRYFLIIIKGSLTSGKIVLAE